jgi:hypothetical protein
MAVKVLDDLDPALIKRVSCRNCASRLEYVQSDVKERHGRDISGCADGESYVDCPKCGGRAIIRSW